MAKLNEVTYKFKCSKCGDEKNINDEIEYIELFGTRCKKCNGVMLNMKKEV